MSRQRIQEKQAPTRTKSSKNMAQTLMSYGASSTEPSTEEVNVLVALYGNGQVGAAETLARSLTMRFPVQGFGWKVLGAVLQSQNRDDEALICMQKAAMLMPQDAEALNNLATNLQRHYRVDEAIDCLRQSLGIDPAYAMGHFNLGSMLRLKGQLVEAEAHLRRAVAIDPDYADAHVNLGMTLQDQGYTSEAIQCYRRALKIKPDYAMVFSNLLFALGHDLWTDPQQLFAEHLAFGEQFEAPLRVSWQPHGNTKDPDRQLQIGFVSADLYGHAVANFIGPVLEQLSKNADLVLHAYYNNTIDDATSERLRSYFAHWHPVAAMSDTDLAETIRADGIDILIDLSGHTARNRLLTFARKPAPIQASWIGYPGTTGLQAMDYYLCDRFLVPTELTWQFTEKTAYLPISVPFAPSAIAPAVNALPALTNDFITFGSFNRHDKLNIATIALWCRLLEKVPAAKLLIGSTPHNQQETIFNTFENNGIARVRLAFAPRSDLLQYLTLHNYVDICLDTFPYNGGTTTAHASWMGVPTLTLAGETMPTRSGSCIMSHLGLSRFIATSIDDFVNLGEYWTTHINELSDLRAGLRNRFNESAYRQPEVFANCFNQSLRTMWSLWCNELPAAPIDSSSVNGPTPERMPITAIN